jgi:hypothetical protein
MKELIEKINPPWLLKPNRGALFATLGMVFDLVKQDADKSFNAHFPYLADTVKLYQHGRALSIPRFAYDTDEEYRNRVAAAAFYHTNAGGARIRLRNCKNILGIGIRLLKSF